MQSDAATVADHLDALPEDGRGDVGRVLGLVRGQLPPGYVETMRWGMFAWEAAHGASCFYRGNVASGQFRK